MKFFQKPIFLYFEPVLQVPMNMQFFRTKDGKMFIIKLTPHRPLISEGMVNICTDEKHMHLSFGDLNAFSGGEFEM